MVHLPPQPDPAEPDWHRPLLAILPRIQHYARRSFAGRGRQVREEAVAEVVGHATHAVRNLVLAGKDPLQFAGSIAFFAVLRAKSGRLVAGACDHDIFSPVAQERGGFVVHGLQDDNSIDTPGWKAAVVQDDKRCTPADLCCFKLDFADWLGTLSRKDRRLATRLAVGDRPGQIARRVQRSPAWVTKWRKALRKNWLRFRGELVEQDAGAGSARLAPAGG
jgi:hypothetical protein